MGQGMITVDTKGVIKLLNNLNIQADFVMYDSYLLKDVHSVLVNFPREYAQENMMLYI